MTARGVFYRQCVRFYPIVRRKSARKPYARRWEIKGVGNKNIKKGNIQLHPSHV